MFPERTVEDTEIAQYAPLVEHMAWRYAGFRNCEFDDLRQEGLIAVWNALKFCNTPTVDIIKERLRAWVRHVTREGMGGYDEYIL